MAFKPSCQAPLLKQERMLDVVVTDLGTVGSFCFSSVYGCNVYVWVFSLNEGYLVKL